MNRVILVGCVKQKHAGTYAAEELYTSPLFKKRRAYAEATGDPWFILSAAYGLVQPERAIESYDVAMADLTIDERQAWGVKVGNQLERALLDLASLAGPLIERFEGYSFEVHAGNLYVWPLIGPLTGRGGELELPLRGLGIGRQLAWYGRRCPTCGGSLVTTSAGGRVCGGYCPNV